jgi:hypothetical protein
MNKSLVLLLTFVLAQTSSEGATGQVAGPTRQNANQSIEKEPGDSHNTSAVSWDSLRLRGIDRELTGMGFAKVDAKDREGDEQNALRRILEKSFSRGELHQLGASFATLPVDPKNWGDFEKKLVWATIDSCLKSGDRDGLVLILSLRCPRRICCLDIENFLAVCRRTFRDPITVLGEAYDKCKIPETRHAIADAARRAFTGSGIDGKDDQQFIQNAMRWYDANKSRLEPNWHYGERSTTHNGEDYETNPLFVRSPDDRPRLPSK